VRETLTIPTPDDPAEALAAVVALRRLAEQLERAAVARAIEQGWTWADIAESLGVTRQAAHKRHAHIVRRLAP
jgi:DNA-directed RNA polymerase specialized sigma24 family protein